MAKTMRKTLVYGILLAAGVMLGMQLAESGTSTIYGPGFQTGGTAINGQTIPSYYGSELQQNAPSAWPANTAPVWPGSQSSGATPGTGNSYGAGYGYGITSPGAGNPSAGTPAAGGQTGQPYGDSALQTPADLLLPPQTPPAVDRFADKTAHLLQQVSQKSIHWVASLFGPEQ